MTTAPLHREDTPPLSLSPRVQAARDRIHDALSCMTVERLELSARVLETLVCSSHLCHDQVTRVVDAIATYHAERRSA